MAVIGALIGVVIVILLLGVVYWGIQQLLPLIPLPDPFRQIVHVVMVLILVLIVIYIILVLLSAVGIHVPLFHTELAGIQLAAL
jgi:hypothetical protein